MVTPRMISVVTDQRRGMNQTSASTPTPSTIPKHAATSPPVTMSTAMAKAPRPATTATAAGSRRFIASLLRDHPEVKEFEREDVAETEGQVENERAFEAPF